MNKVIDKNELLVGLTTSSSLIIELGCGAKKKNPTAIGIDILDYPEVDIVGDIFEVFKKFPDSCVAHISSYHFIEHISNLDLFMSELQRIIKPGGVIDFVAPHFTNPYFYSNRVSIPTIPFVETSQTYEEVQSIIWLSVDSQ